MLVNAIFILYIIYFRGVFKHPKHPPKYGLAGNALNWLTSYLEGRHFFIALGSAKSDTLPSTTGVPQGSVLGPFLFSMFISPVSFLIQSFGIQHHQYADDTQLYTSLASSGNQSRDNITHCAEAVNRWFLENEIGRASC